jgi:hypothetical protein
MVWEGEEVHLGALLWRHVWDRWVLEDTTVEELHDVEDKTPWVPERLSFRERE